jgi:enoyl-CoA hydratase/carnithine racemase
MTDERLVHSRVEDGVALLTWDRSDRHNAWTLPLQTAYFDALEAAEADQGVTAIVVTGAGSVFCPGGDVEILHAAGGQSHPLGVTTEDPRPLSFPLSIRKPTIAAINGACAGIGLIHALMLDVRFAAGGAKFTTAFTRIGLVAEGGISVLLSRAIGSARAMDLLLSARRLDAAEALACGLVARVSPDSALLDDALTYARDIAQNCSPAAMAEVKRQVLDDLTPDLARAVAKADQLSEMAMRGPDFVEGVASFLEGRRPTFSPLGTGTVFA